MALPPQAADPCRPDGARSRSAIELAPADGFEIGYLGRSRDLIND